MKNTRLSRTNLNKDTTRCLLSAAAYPLYDYAPDASALSAVIYGSGNIAYEMLCTFSWAGQMLRIDSDKILNRELTLCAALPEGQDAEAVCRRLTEQAPMLASISDLPAARPEDRLTEADDPNLPYVRYRFRTCGVRSLPDLLPGCRYFVIDLAAEEETRAAVRTLADELTRRDAKGSFIILHTAAQQIDCGGNVRTISLNCDSEELRRWDELLFKRAFSVHYFYSRSGNPFLNRIQTLDKVLEEIDYFLSSLQAAASTGYKLASLNIDPHADRETVTEAYLSCLNAYSPTRIERALIYIEHRRWIITQALEGYCCPTAQQLDEHCFTGIGSDENKFRCKKTTPRYHNCMAVSRLDTPLLQDHLNTMSAWEAQSESPEVIARSPYDALDKQSLTCHMLARRKAKVFEAMVPEWLKEVCDEAVRDRPAAQAAASFRTWLCAASTARDFAQIDAQFDMMKGLLPKSEALKRLEAAVMVKKQYLSRWDYKASDKDVIDVLMLDACTSDTPAVLIKLPASNAIDNIAAALMIDPEWIIYPGMQANDVIRRFFFDRGDNIQPTFCPEDTVESLIAAQQQQGRRIIIDATGARAEDISHAVRLALKDPRIALTACDIKSQKMLNMLNFSVAPLIHGRNISLTAHEAFMLCGAGLAAGVEESFSRHELDETVPLLWNTFYAVQQQDMRKTWKEGIRILQQYLKPRNTCLLKINICDIRNQKAGSATITQDFGSTYFTAHLSDFFAQLKKHGIILDFNEEQKPLVTLHYNPNLISKEQLSEKLIKNLISTENASEGLTAPPRIIADENAKFLIPPESMTFDNIPVDNSFVASVLNTLVDLQLLTVTHSDNKRASITFANAAARFACQQEGNLLELYCYHQVLSHSSAADALISFPVRWTEDSESALEDVTNEIDVIATNGFLCAVISCKDTKPDKNHIYEIISIANMLAGDHAFPFLATPFEPLKASEQNSYQNVLNRANAMNVFFVGTADLGQLGKLVTRRLG